LDGALLSGNSKASPFCPSGKGNMKMRIGHWWNATERGKLKYWEKNIIVWVADE
jgi:hypothetical protein